MMDTVGEINAGDTLYSVMEAGYGKLEEHTVMRGKDGRLLINGHFVTNAIRDNRYCRLDRAKSLASVYIQEMIELKECEHERLMWELDEAANDIKTLRATLCNVKGGT